LANINGFFDPLITLLDRMSAEGFMRRKERDLIGVATEAQACLDALGTTGGTSTRDVSSRHGKALPTGGGGARLLF
jgi:predicted Rossmann-fold nucleotide-binding protein